MTQVVPEAKRVRVGCHVFLKAVSKTEEAFEVELARPEEVDPEHSKISIASPLGKALLHRREGDIITVETPSGEITYTIVRIS